MAATNTDLNTFVEMFRQSFVQLHTSLRRVLEGVFLLKRHKPRKQPWNSKARALHVLGQTRAPEGTKTNNPGSSGVPSALERIAEFTLFSQW